MPLAFRHSILALGLLAAACGQSGDVPVEAVVIGQPGAPLEKGVRLSYGGQLVRAATAEGLVGFDEQGRIVPALAERWIVTDDGLSYIFRLRDGTWLDKAPLSAESAVAALEAALAEVKGAPLAAELAGIEAVVARAGRVVEIQLAAPNPDFLQGLAQPELGLARKGRGAGPMRLTSERRVAILTPIAPLRRGLPPDPDWDERQRALRLRGLPADRAIARFEDGEASLVLGGRAESLPLARDVGIARGRLEFDPVAGLFGFAVTGESGFLADAEHREALAMAIDRDGLGKAFGAEGWQPTNRVVAPGMDGDTGAIGERWPGQTQEELRRVAAGRVARWRAQHGKVALAIALPAGPGADSLFQHVARDLAGIGVEARRAGEGAPADLRLVDVVARYARASWFLAQLSCAARGAPCSEEADRIAAQARREPDAAKRADLFADAAGPAAALDAAAPRCRRLCRQPLGRASLDSAGPASQVGNWRPPGAAG